MENKTFEQLVTELEAIVKELEEGNLGLEESVTKYQLGMALSVECKKRLDDAKSVIVTKMTETKEVNF